MKYVIVTEGTWGDILPFAAIGKKIKEKGYRVIVCTNEKYKNFIIEQDLEFVQTTSISFFKKVIEDKRFWQPIGGVFLISRYLGELFEKSYPIIKSQIDSGDIVLSHTFTFAGKVAAQVKGAHYINILLSPIQARTRFQLPIVLGKMNANKWPKFFSKYFYEVADFLLDNLVPSSINKLILKEGLPRAKSFMNYGVSTECCIALWPDWYCPVYEDQKSFLKLAGFPQDILISNQEEKDLVDWILQGEKPIIATMGSGYFFNKKFVKIVTQISKKLDKRFIVLVQEDFFKDTPNVLFRKHVNLKKILPLSEIFIYHGGVGTLAQAISNGIPGIIIPMTHDQPDNAYRVEQKKLGVFLPESKLSVKRLMKKIIEIEQNSDIFDSVQEAKQKCVGIDGITNAVKLIEEFVQTKK